jgi:polar amino acid transport system substrate-binding protein
MGPKANGAVPGAPGKLRPMKNAALLTLLLTLAGTALAQPAGTLERIKANGGVTLGYGVEARPFSFQDSADKPIGYGVELCTRVAATLKAQPRFVRLARDEGLRAVAERKVDLLCDAIVPTPASRKEVSYSIPVFATGIGAVVLKDRFERVSDLVAGRPSRSSQPYRFAMITASRAEQAVIERLRERKLDISALAVKDFNAGIDAVTAQRADAFFADRAALLDTVKRGPRAGELQVLERYFTHDALAFALARGDEDFRLAVDHALSGFFQSEAFRPLYARWFGEPSDETLSLFRLGALRE